MVDLRQARSTDGWLIFAAVIMFIVGFHNLIYGIASLRDYIVVVDNLNSTSTGTGVIYANTTFWGWLWIAVGIVEMGIAFGIAAGNELARWVGIVIAALNAIGQLAFLAAFPVWSVIIIAIDILVIYALATYQSRVYAGGGVEPYPGDRPGVGRGTSARARSGAYAGAASGGTGSGGRPGNAGGGGDFFEPTAGRGDLTSGHEPSGQQPHGQQSQNQQSHGSAHRDGTTATAYPSDPGYPGATSHPGDRSNYPQDPSAYPADPSTHPQGGSGGRRGGEAPPGTGR